MDVIDGSAARDSNFIIWPLSASLGWRVPLAAETDGDDLIEFVRALCAMREWKKEKWEAEKGESVGEKAIMNLICESGG